MYAFAEDTLGSHPMSGTPAQGMAYSRLKSLAQADAQFDGIECECGLGGGFAVWAGGWDGCGCMRETATLFRCVFSSTWSC